MRDRSGEVSLPAPQLLVVRGYVRSKHAMAVGGGEVFVLRRCVPGISVVDALPRGD